MMLMVVMDVVVDEGEGDGGHDADERENYGADKAAGDEIVCVDDVMKRIDTVRTTV